MLIRRTRTALVLRTGMPAPARTSKSKHRHAPDNSTRIPHSPSHTLPLPLRIGLGLDDRRRQHHRNIQEQALQRQVRPRAHAPPEPELDRRWVVLLLWGGVEPAEEALRTENGGVGVDGGVVGHAPAREGGALAREDQFRKGGEGER